MRIAITVLAIVTLGARSVTAARSCDGLAGLVLADTTITGASVVLAEAYCRVQGVVAPANRFEVWLPTGGWNGKLPGRRQWRARRLHQLLRDGPRARAWHA
jgi:hypothetical protein